MKPKKIKKLIRKEVAVLLKAESAVPNPKNIKKLTTRLTEITKLIESNLIDILYVDVMRLVVIGDQSSIKIPCEFIPKPLLSRSDFITVDTLDSNEIQMFIDELQSVIDNNVIVINHANNELLDELYDKALLTHEPDELVAILLKFNSCSINVAETVIPGDIDLLHERSMKVSDLDSRYTQAIITRMDRLIERRKTIVELFTAFEMFIDNFSQFMGTPYITVVHGTETVIVPEPLVPRNIIDRNRIVTMANLKIDDINDFKQVIDTATIKYMKLDIVNRLERPMPSHTLKEMHDLINQQ